MFRIVAILLVLLCSYACAWAQRSDGSSHKDDIKQVSYAWKVVPPLGLREPAEMDTLNYNFYQRAVPSTAYSYAWACTGNMGGEGKNMLFMQSQPISQFFLEDAKRPWLPAVSKLRFYNTRLPLTQATYDAGGDRNNSQERLKVVFSGNVNKRLQIGANLDYIYSKGSYKSQAAKGFTWGFNGSYIGDRYEVQASWQHFNMLNQESGGITDPLYITDPAKLQGGYSTINPKSIPTNLSHAFTRMKGGELFLNNKYNVGYWHEEYAEEDPDSVVLREYIPVTAFVWNLNFRNGMHRFLDNSTSETRDFFENTYLNPFITDDHTSYWKLTNTVGISLLEDFNKYAKFGLSAFLTHEIRKFTQTVDTIDRALPDDIGLSPFPSGLKSVLPRNTQNLLWVGAQITKQKGSILRYEATGEIGIAGVSAGDVKVYGHVNTDIPLLGDTVSISGYGSFYNTAAPYLLNNFLSNHFIWHNNFGKERRLRLGGILNIPWTRTGINVGTETLQNFIYFGTDARPVQHSGGIQVFSATLSQNFKLGILHWDNTVTYQTSSNEDVLPLPKLALYSNLYLQCKIATLHLQLGVDCDYYTRYYAPAYQPATATFYNQHKVKLGNYPFMSVYANMRLDRVRFYVMMTNINQGWPNKEYFSSPGYPLNPRRFQMGLSVDFYN